MILFLWRSTQLTGKKESSVKKEEFDALVKSLGRQGLPETSGRDADHKLQPTQSALLTSVFSTPPCWVPY